MTLYIIRRWCVIYKHRSHFSLFELILIQTLKGQPLRSYILKLIASLFDEKEKISIYVRKKNRTQKRKEQTNLVSRLSHGSNIVYLYIYTCILLVISALIYIFDIICVSVWRGIFCINFHVQQIHHLRRSTELRIILKHHSERSRLWVLFLQIFCTLYLYFREKLVALCTHLEFSSAARDLLLQHFFFSLSLPPRVKC